MNKETILKSPNAEASPTKHPTLRALKARLVGPDAPRHNAAKAELVFRAWNAWLTGEVFDPMHLHNILPMIRR